jgi:uncharacterized membrane protein
MQKTLVSELSKIYMKEIDSSQRFRFYNLENTYVGLCFFALLSILSVLKIYNLHSSYFDFGLFDKLYWNICNQSQWEGLLSGHVQILSLIEVFLYKYYPSSILLSILQAFLISSGIFFLHHFNSHKTHLRIALISYLLYFPVWYNALFDFHVDHMAVPLMFLFYFGCYKNKWLLCGLASVLLAFVKEPFALVTFFSGIYILIRWKRFGLGVFLCIFGAIYFYIATSIILPKFSFGLSSGFETEAFSWLGKTVSEILLSIITNPYEVLTEIAFNYQKLIYLACIFGALLFIPIFGMFELIPIIPILGISLLSRLENHYGIGHHYTAGLIAPIIVSFSVGLPKVEGVVLSLSRSFIGDNINKKIVFKIIIAMMVGINILISPSPISRIFWSNKIWNYGIEAYFPSDRNNMIKSAIKKHIPKDKDIAVSVQNTVNYDYLSKRKFYYPFPMGVFKPIDSLHFEKINSKKNIAQFIVLDLKRPWYIVDQGCNWKEKGKFELSEDEIKKIGLKENPGPIKWASCAKNNFRKKFIYNIIEARKTFNIVFEKDGFIIMEKLSL